MSGTSADTTLRDVLLADQWQSPNTYSNAFAEPPDAPGLYLLICFDGTTAAAMYAGMSLRLARRLAGHPVMREIRSRGHAQIWFKPIDAALPELRQAEKALIHRFRPPFNIIGRVRGEAWA